MIDNQSYVKHINVVGEDNLVDVETN